MPTSAFGITINDKKPSFPPKIAAPLYEILPFYNVTSEKLSRPSYFTVAKEDQLTKHKNKIIQLGKRFCFDRTFAYLFDINTYNKVFNADILFSCKSELDGRMNMSSTGQILFRAVKADVPSVDNPCYIFEYEDNGYFRFRIGRQSSYALTYLNDWINVEKCFNTYVFNNLKIGFLNDEFGLKVLVYFNDRPLVNLMDPVPVPECMKPGYICFVNGMNALFIKGVDVKRYDPPVGFPVYRGTVSGCNFYDISRFSDYSFRDLVYLLNPRTYYDDNGAIIPYRLFLPGKYDPAKKYPLMMYLHGAGLKGDDNLKQLGYDRNFYKAFLDIQKQQEMIFIFPQCIGKSWNDGDYD